ncbi:hypothetical protein SBOR_3433 [Sclerotinia borealis F-4128]|uniref:N-acetyltransferase domain-containing protein n=1 Tax=Sclerotinia borealis (strain F-4128) TaxID=1432307 RepID=W9CJH0_SCLBF|nr:hypothetical protein SBOR_3433 [Sclerotinia borealis F-4128]
MSPTLHTVTTLAQFSLVRDCMWESFSIPYSPYMSILFPIKTPTAEGLAAAIQESKERLWGFHEGDEDSVWVYVVDEDEDADEDEDQIEEDGKIGGNEKVLAAANWLFHKKNPFGEEEKKEEEEEKGTADVNEGEKKDKSKKNIDEKSKEKDNDLGSWWPEGEARDFTKKVLPQLFDVKKKRMRRPHAQLSLMYTLPTSRGRGHGSLIMKFGMSRISEMDVEAVVEASADGLTLYEKFGFRTVDVITMDTTFEMGKEEGKEKEKEKPGYIWRKMAYELGEKRTWWMWKPRPGKRVYERGMDVPWEERG